MPMYDREDLIELKNKKKRKKRLIRLTVIIVLAVIGAVIYFTQELWLPKLQGLGEHYTTIVNDGRLAEGNFPIEINGGSSYQMDCTNDCAVVLCDAYVYFYSQEGGLIKKRQHAYTNAVMNVASNRVLIYEIGGNKFSVEDRNGVIYSETFEKNIIFVRLSKDGYAAVVTTSDNYSCEMSVFDRRGKMIYERKCIELINDICFNDDSSGCVISYIYAENGSMTTSVQELSFTDDKEKWTSPGLDTFAMHVYGFDGGAAVIGFDACGYVDSTGQITSFYRYDGKYAGGSGSGGKSAVIINNEDRRKYVMALFNGGTEPIMINFESPLIDVCVSGGLAYVMTQDSIYAYDFSGNLRSTAQISDSYTGFARSGSYVFLKSFSKIDRINYES